MARQVAGRLRAGGSFQQVRAQWEGLARGTEAEDVAPLTQWALREAYAENVEMQRRFAERVERLNEEKRLVREELDRLRRAQSGADRNGESFAPDPRLAALLERRQTGARTGRAPRETATAPSSELDRYGRRLESALRDIESDLKAMGDGAELADADLQGVLQKQQQMLQMLSELSRQLHESAMAVIRNMKG